MAYDPARPLYTLKLAGKEYDLVGTFDLIEAVEHALKEGIIQIAVRIMDMGVSDTAKVIAAMLRANGEKVSALEIGEIIYNDIGINTDGYALLKINLSYFLKIMLSPPSDREATAKEVGELIGKLERPASRGETTKVSA